MVEICERKGKGHPDTICDSIMNQVSIELSKEYKKRFGVILHHNVDKCLLGAGSSVPAFGGGKITNPMQIIFGDRATYRVGDEVVDVGDIAEKTAIKWFNNNFRFVRPENIEFRNNILPGSYALQDIFIRSNTKYLGANDTSATVGYAPYTPLERAVIDIENILNSGEYKTEHPEVGEDIKVMAIREGEVVDFTVAIAMVDVLIKDEDSYFKRKAEISNDISNYLVQWGFDKNTVNINAGDTRDRDTDGLYLTVTGTSAEAGDSGQVGRGNDVRGIIPLNRPASSEAAAGKNPTSHVGKIYNVFGHYVADKIIEKVPGIEEVYVWMVSQIGQPINIPKMVSVQFIPTNLDSRLDLASLNRQINSVVEAEFEHLDNFCLLLGEGDTFGVC